jgi:hypothetical protein
VYIYFHFQDDWDKPNAMAFNKPEQAAEYVVERIEEYLGCGAPKKPKKVKKSGRYGETRPTPAIYYFEQIEQYQPPAPADPFLQPPPAQPAIPNPLQNVIQRAARLIPQQAEPVPNPYQSYYDLMDQKYEEQKTSNTDLSSIQEQIVITTANKTIENAQKLINQYDEYMNKHCHINSFLHTVQEIGVIDESK